MVRFRDLDLRQYWVSATSGFLPDTNPLGRLPDPLYSPWEDIVNDLPHLIKTDSLCDAVDSLPVVSTAKLRTEEEWRRAYLILGFLSQGYIWSGKEPRKVRNEPSCLDISREAQKYTLANPSTN
jgi:indoleamine 2,3-dioxygenase